MALWIFRTYKATQILDLKKRPSL